jgi:hypothetical protein
LDARIIRLVHVENLTRYPAREEKIFQFIQIHKHPSIRHFSSLGFLSCADTYQKLLTVTLVEIALPVFCERRSLTGSPFKHIPGQFPRLTRGWTVAMALSPDPGRYIFFSFGEK